MNTNMNVTVTDIQVLLVENDENDIISILRACKKQAIASQVHVVRDGQEALDYLFGRRPYTDHNQYPLPRLILLDLNLPKVDGFEVLERIKSTPVLRRIPVVILTASITRQDLVRCYDSGANGYLMKPMEYKDLEELIQGVNSFWLKLNVPPPLT
ncbi:MAG: response regulator [Candidatus Bipolaricaulia bacterium]